MKIREIIKGLLNIITGGRFESKNERGGGDEFDKIYNDLCRDVKLFRRKYRIG